MDASSPDVSEDPIPMLEGTLRLCDRIEAHTDLFARHGKTGIVIQKHFRETLLPACRYYAEQMLESLQEKDAESSADPDASRCDDCLTPFKQAYSALSQGLTALSLLQTEADIGDADELDALFCEFIINKPESYFRERDIVRLYGLGRRIQAVTKLLSPWLRSAVFAKCQQGPLRQSLPNVPPAIQSAISEFALAVAAVAKPRQLINYGDNPPYTWDSTTDPVSGSHCIVRKATSQITGEVVAIKTISKVSRPRDRQRVLCELGVLELCDHQNLIKLLDAYETPNGKIHLVTAPWAPFTLLDFLQKSDLALQKRCPWFQPAAQCSNRVILRLFDNLAAGVEELHRMSIKHKDLKPDNILLNDESSVSVQAIITDCGVSKIYRDGGPTDYINSTYPYLAPEQLLRTLSSLKADIWQLGCCFSLALARACGGRAAVDELWESFSKTDENRSCNIATERSHFVSTLLSTCAQCPQLLDMILCMLREDPQLRWDIKMVRAELSELMQ